MGMYHDADHGGFIFAPEVGLHEGVHELDFSSLYLNICTRNVSPDVIRCKFHVITTMFLNSASLPATNRLPRRLLRLSGFSNAKSGRIECHDPINAFAREILLTAKHYLEAGG